MPTNLDPSIETLFNLFLPIVGMLKKAASGVLALLPCSRTESTLRAPKELRPCWTDFFEHSRQLLMSISPRACMCHGSEIFNRPIVSRERLSVPKLPKIDPPKPNRQHTQTEKWQGCGQQG